MAFLPYESKVFTLDYSGAFSDFYLQVRGEGAGQGQGTLVEGMRVG